MNKIIRTRTTRIWSIILSVILYLLPGLQNIAYAAAPISNTAYVRFTGHTYGGTNINSSNMVLTDYAKCNIIPVSSNDTGEQAGYAYIPHKLVNIGSVADTFLFRASNSYGTKSKFYLDTGVVGTYDAADTQQIAEVYLAVNDTFAYITAVYVPETTPVGNIFLNYDTVALYNFTETPAQVEEARAMSYDAADTINVVNTIAPDSPYLLGNVETQPVDALVKIVWGTSDFVFDLSYYNIYRSTISGGDTVSGYTFIDSTPYSPTYYNDNNTSLMAGVTYYYVATAVDSYGNTSDTSNEIMRFIYDKILPETPLITKVVPDTYGRALTIYWDTDTIDTDLNYYILQRSSSSVFASDTVTYTLATSRIDTDASDNFLKDTGLANGLTYYYRIERQDIHSLKSGFYDTSFYGVPEDSRAPDSPTGLAVLADTRGQRIDITWNYDGDSDIVWQKIYRSTNGQNFANIAPLPVGITGYADTGLTNGVTYYYYMTALDTRYYSQAQDTFIQNESPPSDSVVAEAIDLVPPGGPYNGSISRNIPGREVSLTWNYSDTDTDFYRFRIYRSTSIAAAFTNIDTASSRNFTDTTVTQLTRDTAFYKIVAIDTSGNESDSVILETGPMTPGVIKSVAADSAGRTIHLVWSVESDTNIKYIRIYRATAALNFSVVDTLVSSATGYSDTGLPNYITYYYRFTALDAAKLNESIYSDSVSAFTYDSTPPPAPINFKASADTSNITIHLTWSAATLGDVSKYMIYRSTADTNYNEIATQLAGETSYIDTNVKFDGRTYYYYIEESDTYANISDSSATNIYAPDLTPPPVPFNFTAENFGDSNYLNWQDTGSSDIYRFKIYRSTSIADTFTNIDTLLSNKTYYYDVKLSTAVLVYYYFVTAIDTAGNESDSSNVDSAAILKVTSAWAITGKQFRIVFSRDLNDSANIDTSRIIIMNSDSQELPVESASVRGETLNIMTAVQTYGDTYIIRLKIPITPVSIDIGPIRAGYIKFTRILNNRGGLLQLPVLNKNQIETITLSIPAGVLPNSIDSTIFVMDTVPISLIASDIQIANYSITRNSAYSLMKEKYDAENYSYVVEIKAETEEKGASIFRKTYHNIPANLFEAKDTYPVLSIPYLHDGSQLGNDKGVKINEQSLKVLVLDENKLMWKPVATVPNGIAAQAGNYYVRARLNHLSIYTIAGLNSISAGIMKIKVYPNPYIPNSQAGHSHYIWFTNVSEDVQTIEIYDISGDLVTVLHRVDELEEGSNGIKPPGAHWTATNEAGEAVASGLYIFVPKDSSGRALNYAIGKIAIIK